MRFLLQICALRYLRRNSGFFLNKFIGREILAAITFAGIIMCIIWRHIFAPSAIIIAGIVKTVTSMPVGGERFRFMIYLMLLLGGAKRWRVLPTASEPTPAMGKFHGLEGTKCKKNFGMSAASISTVTHRSWARCYCHYCA